LHEKGKTPNF